MLLSSLPHTRTQRKWKKTGEEILKKIRKLLKILLRGGRYLLVSDARGMIISHLIFCEIIPRASRSELIVSTYLPCVCVWVNQDQVEEVSIFLPLELGFRQSEVFQLIVQKLLRLMTTSR